MEFVAPPGPAAARRGRPEELLGSTLSLLVSRVPLHQPNELAGDEALNEGPRFAATSGRAGSRLRPARTWSIASPLGWAKTYDAEYVALAEVFDVPLLSIDQRLQRGAGAIVRILSPTDL